MVQRVEHSHAFPYGFNPPTPKTTHVFCYYCYFFGPNSLQSSRIAVLLPCFVPCFVCLRRTRCVSSLFRSTARSAPAFASHSRLRVCRAVVVVCGIRNSILAAPARLSRRLSRLLARHCHSLFHGCVTATASFTAAAAADAIQ